jgi:hypothetical protein
MVVEAVAPLALRAMELHKEDPAVVHQALMCLFSLTRVPANQVWDTPASAL